MKIVVINGTEKRGVTYTLKEIFLTSLKVETEVAEYYLPKDCPNFCAGCTSCFTKGETACKDSIYIQKIEKEMLQADLLVLTSPAYVMHVSGAMKTLLDHLGYRWLPHRPAKEMFGKRAVIITQCVGAGGKSAAKDIKHSLSWWGISYIKIFTAALIEDVIWNKLSQKKRKNIEKKITKYRCKDKQNQLCKARPYGHCLQIQVYVLPANSKIGLFIASGKFRRSILERQRLARQKTPVEKGKDKITSYKICTLVLRII